MAITCDFHSDIFFVNISASVMQVDATVLSVQPGQIIIPMLNGIVALLSEKSLKFYSWINSFSFLVSVSSDMRAMMKPNVNITVTADNKLLVMTNELSLQVYSLKHNTEDDKYSVSLRTLMQVERTKDWIEANMKGDPYFIGESTTGGGKLLFYVNMEESSIFAAADVGIRVSEYDFWCIFRNRIILYDTEMKQLFYFALIGGSHTSSIPVSSPPRGNTVVGNSTVISFADSSYVFWNVDTALNYAVVPTSEHVSILCDKYAIMSMENFSMCDSSGSKVRHTNDTVRLLFGSEILTSWAPDTDSAPRAPSSARSSSAQAPRNSPRCTEKTAAPKASSPRRSSSPRTGTVSPRIMVEEATNTASTEPIPIASGTASLSRSYEMSAPKLGSDSSPTSRHRRTPSGNPIRDALIKRNSRGQMLASMGKVLLQNHDSSDLTVACFA